jgi:PAS domain S-box-containing protein
MVSGLPRHLLIPLLFLLLGTALVALLGIENRKNDHEHLALETSVTAEQVQIRLQTCVDRRTKLISVLANTPWNSEQQLVENWAAHASTLYPLYDGIQALNYIDNNRVIRSVYPAEPNLSALNADLRDHPNASVRSAISQAEASTATSRTAILELLQSGMGFALYRQIRSPDGVALGFVNGVFRGADLLENCLSEQRLRDNFLLRVFDQDTLFHQSPAEVEVRGDHMVSVSVDVAGIPWRLQISPLPGHIEAPGQILDIVWIALGLLLSILLALTVRSLLIKQRDLSESEDKYRLLVESQTDMLVKVNPEGEFLYVSPSYCETFGKSEDELLGKHFMPLVHEDDREDTARSLESLINPPHTSYHEQRAMTKDGWRWLGWSNTAVMNSAKEIAAITAVGRDITEIKSLESRVAHTQKMKALGEMAGGITHDFNNLLQVIYGNVEFILMKGDQGEQVNERLERVRDVVDRAMKLTQKLSTLSRQEATEKEVIELNAFSEDLITLLQHTLPTSIKLSRVAQESPLYVHADRALLEQVLLNICFNARDAVESIGSIEISLQQKRLDKKFLGPRSDNAPGDYALIEVRDDGCGIEADALPRIFDPFFTTKGLGTGTGLGLANCYSIVKQHNGLILADSVPGEGSCFSIYLPLAGPGLQGIEDSPKAA